MTCMHCLQCQLLAYIASPNINPLDTAYQHGCNREVHGVQFLCNNPWGAWPENNSTALWLGQSLRSAKCEIRTVCCIQLFSVVQLSRPLSPAVFLRRSRISGYSCKALSKINMQEHRNQTGPLFSCSKWQNNVAKNFFKRLFTMHAVDIQLEFIERRFDLTQVFFRMM